MDDIRVQVCYATTDRQFLRELAVPEGSTVRAAIEHSAVMEEFPDIDLDRMRVGIYGKLKTLDTVLRERDRVEIYRPLIADPKEARRRRATKNDKK